MLHGTLAFVAVAALAVIGWEIRHHRRRTLPSLWALERLAFLVLGFALAEGRAGLLPADVIVVLEPVVLIALAWIGLVYGLGIDLATLGRLTSTIRRTALLLPLLPGALVGGGAVLLGRSPLECVALAALAMTATPAYLDRASRQRRPVDRGALRLLRVATALAGVPALATFGIGASFLAGAGNPESWRWAWEPAVLAFALGAVAAYVLISLVRSETDQVTILALLLGVMAFVAGLAQVIGAPGLCVATVTGALFLNRCAFPHRVLREAHRLELPLLLALLLLVGASWDEARFSLPVFVLLAPVRTLGCLLAGDVLAKIARAAGSPTRVPLLGLGLLTQGPLAIGLVVALVRTADGLDGVLEAVVAANVVNHAIAALWARRALLQPTAGKEPR